ncbi:MAG: hypothetical protein BroJett024_44110 [Alphaproteobacteria bacterium]|nr:MAG: hypothetical protein BroJett024_44110 [Alphaproteobacteria bacterium]
MAIDGEYKQAVRRALEELERAYPDTGFSCRPDGEGGAFVMFEALPLGAPYEQSTTWMAFRIGFQYPNADVYPHYVRADLKRKDGRPLGEGMSTATYEGRSAVQVSRRSNKLDPAVQTAVLKLEKVLAWLRSRP